MEYSFGTWVKRRRKALDLTQQELARQIGCSPSLIFKIESDERRPSRQMAELLAKELDIPADQRPLFLKTARQEKSTDSLDAIPALSGLEPVPAPRQIPGNLPIPPTPLVGREQEIRTTARQLTEDSCRMLTLIGPGGIGKTRLAIEVGRELEAHFSDGVYFVPLAGIGMTESIIPVLAETLGLTFSGPAEPIVQLSNFLRTKNILLVLDNMEHLLTGGELFGRILTKTQRVKMLITSREQLRLQWEWLFEVQGLSIPRETDRDMTENEAVTLFVQRARQISQGFSLQPEDIPALVRICRLVGGLPLALELAASWVRILSCREIAQELEKSIDFLETRKLDVPQRHRSIKTVFDHSWELLTDEERLLLRKLSVFQGGFTRDAAASATGASLSLLSILVDKSLLRYSKDSDRYDFHELIRQYTFSQLQSNRVDEKLAFEKYAYYYAGWIASLEHRLKSAQQLQTSHLIRAETVNWHCAWHWAIANGRLDLLRKMHPCLNWYFEVHGYYDEALSAYRAAVDGFRARATPTALERAADQATLAFLIDSLGWFEFRTGNVELGKQLLAESLALAIDTKDTEVLYYIYGNWGYLCLETGDKIEAMRLTTESLQYGHLLTPWHTAIPISVLGIVAYQQGNLQEAHAQLTESLKIWRTVGDPRGLVFCMLYLGMTTFALNDIEATRSILKESNRIAEAKMDRWAHAFGLDMLGVVALSHGQNEEALDLFQHSLNHSREIGDQLAAAQTSIHMGQAYAALQCIDDAKQLYREAYAAAETANWIPIILNGLVSFIEVQSELSEEARLAVARSVLSHPAVSPNLRTRCERLQDEIKSPLQEPEVERVEHLASAKTAETWARELLQ